MSDHSEFPQGEFLGRGRRGKSMAHLLALREHQQQQRRRAALEVSIRFPVLSAQDAAQQADEARRAIEKEQRND